MRFFFLLLVLVAAPASQAQSDEAERVAVAYLAALADSAYAEAAALVDPETISFVATRLRGEPVADESEEMALFRQLSRRGLDDMFERRTGIALSDAVESMDPLAFHALLLEHGFAGQESWTALRVGAHPVDSVRDGEFVHVLFRYEGSPVPGQAPGLFALSTREIDGRWHVVPVAESHERIGI
ncbi:MAG: hypothetical protein AAF845_15030 [Bacteroidota bacterium]